MKIYIYIEGTDLDEIADNIDAAVSSWIEENDSKAILVNNQSSSDENNTPIQAPCWELGINIDITKGKQLTKPLNFLYGLAKKHKCNFVLGICDEKSGENEDICYFGKDEGKPDVFEISSYIGVKI